MDDLDTLLADLTERNRRIADRKAEADAEMRDRDEIVRQARAAGATWAQLTATGMSKDTVSKARDGR